MLSYPVLTDPGHRVIDEYGVFHPDEPKGRAIARPAMFLLGRDGIIHHRYMRAEPSDQPATEAILMLLQE